MPIPADTLRLVERLQDPAAYPHPTGAIRLVETHASWVFLTGPFVYKLKKPLDLGFLDYTTLEQRRRSCEEEVRVSGRFAPEIYVAAVPITGAAEAPRVAGDGPALEWAVKLVQFDEADRLDARFDAGRLTPADGERLGAEIAAVELGLPVAAASAAWGSARSIRDAVAINFRQLRELRPDATERAERIEAWLFARLDALQGVIESRRAAGRVRECHGDLHLANIVFHAGRMIAFDAIEFSPGLRWIDVANDVAFLVMDLQSRGRPDLAAIVRSSWIEAADDHAAAIVLPVYEIYRAVVRAAVAALRSVSGLDRSVHQNQPADHRRVAVAAREPVFRTAINPAAERAETDRYLELAIRLMQPRRPVLYVTCGVSGCGKTTLAGRIVAATGAVRLRSDVERKRLAGMRPGDRPAHGVATAELYGPEATRRAYGRLAKLAGTLLDAGTSAVVDAACLKRWQRGEIAAVARERQVPLVWLEIDVPLETALARVATRWTAAGDASDAAPEVVQEQWAAREPFSEHEIEAIGGIAPRRIRVSEADLADPEFAARISRGLPSPT